MIKPAGDYWSETRHPWSCVLFVLPLLAIYEIGLHLLGHTSPEELRNGADVWLREGLARIGLPAMFTAPCVLLAILLTWSLWRRRDQPRDQVSVWVGMAIESAVFALGLLAFSQALWHAASHWLPSLLPCQIVAHAAPRGPEPALELIVCFLGAGIYEETLFRLLIYSGLLALFTLMDLPMLWCLALAGVGSALAFAAAHHLGPSGDPFHGYVFAFRAAAGGYFAWLYHTRGFGVAVGAHAGYDVLVGLLLR